MYIVLLKMAMLNHKRMYSINLRSTTVSVGNSLTVWGHNVTLLEFPRSIVHVETSDVSQPSRTCILVIYEFTAK